MSKEDMEYEERMNIIETYNKVKKKYRQTSSFTRLFMRLNGRELRPLDDYLEMGSDEAKKELASMFDGVDKNNHEEEKVKKNI